MVVDGDTVLTYEEIWRSHRNMSTDLVLLIGDFDDPCGLAVGA